MELLNHESINESMLQEIDCDPQIQKIKFGDRILLYDANSMQLIRLDNDEKINLVGSNTTKFIERMNPQMSKHIVFQVTYACNLNCRYCFVRQHYCDQENSMSYEDMLQYLQKYQGDGPYKTGFFGGEPLMNWENIYKLSEKLKELHAKRGFAQARLHITTNGTLITEEIAEYCAQNGFTWIISLDGDQLSHDENRPYVDGSGSFHDTIRGLKFLADAYQKEGKGNPITVRATFDNEYSQVLNSTKFLNQLMYDGLCSHVSVEPASLGEGCAATDSRFEKNSIKEIRAKFQSQYMETGKWFVEEIRSGRKPSLHHFEMPMQRIYDREFSFTECGAGVGYISIGPNGKVCACHREHKTKMGGNGEINPILQAQWLDNRFFSRTTCNTCWRKFICAGGCRCNSLLAGNTISQPSVMECLFKDLQTRAAMWILSELTEKERRSYSKKYQQKQQQQQQPIFNQAVKPAIVKKPQNIATGHQTCQYDCQSVCMYPEEIMSREQKQIPVKNLKCDCGNEKCNGKK